MEKIQYRKKWRQILTTEPKSPKASAEYSEAKKDVKRSIKSDKKNYIEGLALEAEEAAYQGNTTCLLSTIKKLSAKFKNPERPVKTKEGKSLPDEEGQKKKIDRAF